MRRTPLEILAQVLFLVLSLASGGELAAGQEREKERPEASGPGPARGSTAVGEGRIEREGFTLHYRMLGDQGPHLVLLSGGPGLDVSYLRPLAEELAKEQRCILFEQRGTGRSRLKSYTRENINLAAYLDDLEALRKGLQQERLILVGNSWGMLLALAYAAEHPERAQAVLSVGSGPIRPHYHRIFGDNIDARLGEAERKAIQELRAGGKPDPAGCEYNRILFPFYFYDPRVGRKDAEAFPHQVDPELSPHVWRMCWQVEEDLAGRLPRITAPVLLLHGRQDPCPEQCAIEASQLIKRSSLEFIDRCGHHPWLEQPAETFRRIRAFLGRLPAEP